MTSNVSALAVQASEAPAHLSAATLMLDVVRMEHIVRIGELMAASRTTVPQHLQGKPADCAAIITQAMVWGMNPWAVAQKTHITPGGALGYEAQLVNAVIINNAPIVRRPEFEFMGDWSKILGKVQERDGKNGGKYFASAWNPKDEDGLGVVVRCQIQGEDKPREVTVMMSQAWPRFSTQWATDPQQQITYLAIRKWARRYAPDVILGVYTPDEFDDERVIDIGSGSTADTQPSSTADRFKAATTASDAKPKKAEKAEKPSGPSAAEIIASLEKATTADDVTTAADLARGLADAEDRERVRAVYQKRVAELKAAQKPAAPPPDDHSFEQMKVD